MISEVTKYSDVRAAASRPAPRSLNILVPKRAGERWTWPEWFERELREGGYLHEYLRRERASSERRLRAAARAMQSKGPNPKSDLRLVAAVPAREYHRWVKEDPHFWDDNANLRSLRRDNDAMRKLIFL